MSVHINARKGEIADKILLPGDPLRAKWIAERFLDNSKQYNSVRNMNGYTGYYKGNRVSVQGTGMGMPSASIYINELIQEYKVNQLIRVGSAGSIQQDVVIRDVILAMSASHNSMINKEHFDGECFAPTADFSLFSKAIRVAEQQNLKVKSGNVLSSDTFYHDNTDYYKKWSAYNTLCVEMEVAALYTLAQKHKVQALGILTISDSIVDGSSLDSTLRERSFEDMVKIALETLIS